MCAGSEFEILGIGAGGAGGAGAVLANCSSEMIFSFPVSSAASSATERARATAERMGREMETCLVLERVSEVDDRFALEQKLHHRLMLPAHSNQQGRNHVQPRQIVDARQAVQKKARDFDVIKIASGMQWPQTPGRALRERDDEDKTSFWSSSTLREAFRCTSSFTVSKRPI